MKKYSIAILVAALIALTAGSAVADTYTETVTVNANLWPSRFLQPTDSTTWSHINPYTGGDYEAAVALNLIDSVTLTINASGINPGDESVGVTFFDKDGDDHYLGLLASGNTVFNLQAGWLDGVEVTGTLTYTNNGSMWNPDWTDDATICSSTLTVVGCPVPVPGAVLLGMLGLSVAGARLRKNRVA